MGKQAVVELNGIKYNTATGQIIGDSLQNTTHQATTKNNTVRKSGINPAQRSIQRSKTLMRHGLKYPGKKALSMPEVVSAPKIIGHTEAKRLGRAGNIKQSNLVSRFGRNELPKITTHAKHLPVISEPTDNNSISPNNFSTSAKNEISALDKAQAHTKAKTKKPRAAHRIAQKLNIKPRTVNVLAGLASILFIAGFIIYNNNANITMRLATARSGVAGHFPDYQPAGFSLGRRVSYSPGQITLSYLSNTNDRAFEIVQKTSAWNSETLLEQYVAQNNRPYQIRQNGGKTIYIYEGSNATWVDNGVWYRINGKSSLSSDQLLRIIDSM